MKKQKMIILLLFVTVFCSAVFLGCNAGKIIVPDDHEAAGYQKVRMYYNGGSESSNLSVDYFIPKNGRMPLPSSSQESYLSVPTRSGYELYTWVQVKFDKLQERPELMYDIHVDEQGKTIKNPILNTKNQHASRMVPYIEGHDFTNLDKDEQALTYKDFEDEQREDYDKEKIFVREWNFDFDKVTEDICLVAIWRPMRYFVILPFENINDTINEPGYNKLRLRKIDASGAIIRPAPSQLPTKPGSQVEGLFLDPNYTIPVPFDKENKYYPPAEMLSDDRYKVVPLYAKWLDAKYKIVSSATDIVSEFYKDTNLYVTNDLDFEGLNVRFPSVYSGEIEGNGFAWKNLTINIKQENPRDQRPDNYGVIFGDLVEAKISRVRFENLEVVFERLNPAEEENIRWDRPVSIHMFAKSIDSRSEIRDVKIGTEANPVRCKMVEATSFGLFNQTPALVGGYLQRETKSHGWISADAAGNYPNEGDVAEFNNITKAVEYVYDYLGNPATRLTPLLDDDSKELYGYRLYPAPTNAGDSVGEPTFVENFFDNDEYPRVSGCSVEWEDDIATFDWQAEYGPDIAAPQALSNIVIDGVTYNFAGWYKEVDRTITDGTPNRAPVPYKAYEKFDFNQTPQSTVSLVAIWKLA